MNDERLLIVDDENYIRKYYADVGRRLGFDVALAGSREEFERKLPTFWPSVILLDLQMPDCGGIQMFKLIKELDCDARIVLVSGADQRTIDTALRLGEVLDLNMDGALQKPVLIDSLRSKLLKSREPRSWVDVDELRDAIREGRIKTVYQPKIGRDADGDWRICAAEALARWHRDDSVTILPGEFIEIAEQNNLLSELTRSLIDQVVAQLKDWDSRGLELTAAVNVSPSIFTDPAFPDQVESLMQRNGLDNARMTFELTETAAMRDAHRAMEVLSRIRAKGFGLAIDDFGTGYSSIEQLYRMPFTELKIDRFLVRDIGSRLEAADIAEAIVTLGHKLQLNVCAEGVESEHALSFLLEAGCDTFQGFYIGRPVSAEALEQRAREFKAQGFDCLGWQSDASLNEADGSATMSRPLPLLSL